MNIRVVLLYAIMMCASGSVLSDPVPTGKLTMPFNESQAWSACSKKGWVPYGDPGSHQYHMQWNATYSKYHLGEDWNGACGSSTDEGAPLGAIGDGQVVHIDRVGVVAGKGKQLRIRHAFPYADAPNDVKVFDTEYLHLLDINDSLYVGKLVPRSLVVASLGGTGGHIPHLHWEMHNELYISTSANPYQNQLDIDHALRYLPPSLVVDDRRDEAVFTLPFNGSWRTFSLMEYAPSSTAYVSRGGDLKSLRNAIAAGWIHPYGLIYWRDGAWRYYSNVDDHFFDPGVTYGIKAEVLGVELHIPVPRHGYQQDRARRDMIRAVSVDSRFKSILVETYEHHPDLNPNWELHLMGFKLGNGQVVFANQMTNKENPFARYTTYYDPDEGAWEEWKWVGSNRLY